MYPRSAASFGLKQRVAILSGLAKDVGSGVTAPRLKFFSCSDDKRYDVKPPLVILVRRTRECTEMFERTLAAFFRSY